MLILVTFIGMDHFGHTVGGLGFDRGAEAYRGFRAVTACTSYIEA